MAKPRRRSASRPRTAQRRRAPKKTAAPAKRQRASPRPIAPPKPSAEALLLALARDLAAHAPPSGDVVGPIVDRLVTAYAPDAPLATAMREDWLRGRDDKTARLALAWAREHLRLGLVDVLERVRPPRALDADTLAWLWLAACEALAHEPVSAVVDRAHALAAFLRRS